MGLTGYLKMDGVLVCFGVGLGLVLNMDQGWFGDGPGGSGKFSNKGSNLV